MADPPGTIALISRTLPSPTRPAGSNNGTANMGRVCLTRRRPGLDRHLADPALAATIQ